MMLMQAEKFPDKPLGPISCNSIADFFAHSQAKAPGCVLVFVHKDKQYKICGKKTTAPFIATTELGPPCQPIKRGKC